MANGTADSALKSLVKNLRAWLDSIGMSEMHKFWAYSGMANMTRFFADVADTFIARLFFFPVYVVSYFVFSLIFAILGAVTNAAKRAGEDWF